MSILIFILHLFPYRAIHAREMNEGKNVSILPAVYLNAIAVGLRLLLLLFRKRSFENLLVNRYLKWAQIFKWFQTKYSMNHNLQSEIMVKVVSYIFFYHSLNSLYSTVKHWLVLLVCVYWCAN